MPESEISEPKPTGSELVGAVMGHQTVKVEPRFSPRESTVMRPRCKSTMAFETYLKRRTINITGG